MNRGENWHICPLQGSGGKAVASNIVVVFPSQVFVALEELRKSPSPEQEQIVPIEKLIAEAFSIIDKSVKVGTIHQNKGARRKARLSRAKRATLVSLGWYTPKEEEAVVA